MLYSRLFKLQKIKNWRNNYIFSELHHNHYYGSSNLKGHIS